MSTLDDVKNILGDTLQIGDRILDFDRATPLLGSIPEFDSMVVVSVITGIEEHFGVTVEDDDVSADTFATLGTLADFVDQKIQGR
jgi:acyl carrier protein